MLFSFIYQFNQIVVNQSKFLKKVLYPLSRLIHKITISQILNHKTLSTYLAKLNTKQLYFLCTILKTQEQLDLLYKSGTLQQKAELIKALDFYREIAEPLDMLCLYPSASLLCRDFDEISKIVYPQSYEPEEVKLEKSFSW